MVVPTGSIALAKLAPPLGSVPRSVVEMPPPDVPNAGSEAASISCGGEDGSAHDATASAARTVTARLRTVLLLTRSGLPGPPARVLLAVRFENVYNRRWFENVYNRRCGSRGPHAALT